jgi:hypothetical protein
MDCRSLPNSLVKYPGRVIGRNKCITIWFDSNSKQVNNVSEVDLFNRKGRKRKLTFVTPSGGLSFPRPNSRVKRPGRIIGRNKCITIWFYSNSKQIVSVSLVEWCNKRVSNSDLPGWGDRCNGFDCCALAPNQRWVQKVNPRLENYK